MRSGAFPVVPGARCYPSCYTEREKELLTQEYRMHVVHGTWIPDDTQEFTQRGAFYLWVETDTPSGAARRRGDAAHPHPRHLAHTALAAFLLEKLGRQESFPGTLVRTLSTKYVL